MKQEQKEKGDIDQNLLKLKSYAKNWGQNAKPNKE